MRGVPAPDGADRRGWPGASRTSGGCAAGARSCWRCPTRSCCAGPPCRRCARRYRAFRAGFAIDRLVAAGMGAVCGCSRAIRTGCASCPTRRRCCTSPGTRRCWTASGVAIVGARDAVALRPRGRRALGRGLAAAGVTVVSGMAMGIDSAAHAGALETGADGRGARHGRRPALPGALARPARRIVAAGCVVSEMPPGSRRAGGPSRPATASSPRSRPGRSSSRAASAPGRSSPPTSPPSSGRFVAAVPGPVTVAAVRRPARAAQGRRRARPRTPRRARPRCRRRRRSQRPARRRRSGRAAPGAPPEPAPPPADLAPSRAACSRASSAARGRWPSSSPTRPTGSPSPATSGSSSCAASSGGSSAAATSRGGDLGLDRMIARARPRRAHDRRVGLRRRRGHPGGPEGVRGLRRPRHDARSPR